MAHSLLIIAGLQSLKLFLLLLLPFFIHRLLDGKLSLHELGKNFIFGWHFPLHPGVLQDFLNSWPHSSVELEHGLN